VAGDPHQAGHDASKSTLVRDPSGQRADDVARDEERLAAKFAIPFRRVVSTWLPIARGGAD
jgi:hypothetical protein